MKVSVKQGRASGSIAPPPSKSDAHRALIVAALTDGSVVRRPGDSEDVIATLSCLEALGASLKREDGAVRLGGLDPEKIGECTLNCGESGSTLRFLIPLCLISGSRVTFTGTEKLLSRPLDVYEEICRERGFTFEKREGSLTVAGRLTRGDFTVSASKSSQFATGLMIALSCLGGESTVRIPSGAESMSYVAMTVRAMKYFGAEVREENGIYRIFGGKFRASDYTVEPDFSNAAFLGALGFVGGDVNVTGLPGESCQGDRIYGKLFEAVKAGKAVDLSDCPDLAPVLFAVAAYSGGGRFTGTGRLKYKESDRVRAMRDGLSAFGVTLEAEENSVEIRGKLKRPDRALSSRNDHRIAMALSVLLTVTGGELDGAEAVRKSYPGFFRDLSKLGIEVTEIDA